MTLCCHINTQVATAGAHGCHLSKKGFITWTEKVWCGNLAVVLVSILVLSTVLFTLAPLNHEILSVAVQLLQITSLAKEL